MRLVPGLIAILLALVAGFAFYVRIAPADPARWHVDPRQVVFDPHGGGWLMRDGPADAPAPVFATTPEAALVAFDRVARAQPRVSVLAGSVESLHITYIARSRIWHFPDYVSVVAYPQAGGAALAIWSRQRFGSSDFGVNRARVTAWLVALPRTP